MHRFLIPGFIFLATVVFAGIVIKNQQSQSKTPVEKKVSEREPASTESAKNTKTPTAIPSRAVTLSPTPTSIVTKSSQTQTPTPTTAPTQNPTQASVGVQAGSSFNKKVMLLVYDPIIESQGGKKLSQVFGWGDSEGITNSVIQSLNSASGGQVNYTITEKALPDKFVTYTDGFSYDDAGFLDSWNNGRNFNHGDAGRGTPMLDYNRMLSDFSVCDKLNTGQIDELWVFAYPFAGMWESNMTGPGAYWLNSNPTTGNSCNKKLPIMGWNYERGLAEALHSFGHRVESTMTNVYGGNWQRNESNAWNKFTIRNKDISGKAQCGDVHFPPNATADYDYGNSASVSSACDDWNGYPSLPGAYKSVSCNAWGCSQEGYMKWWLSHLPKNSGETGGKKNNWWDYIVNLN